MKASASISKKNRRQKDRAQETFEAKADPNYRLILFDIDGTLVLTGGAGARAMARAFEQVFGLADAFREIAMAGRTDTWLLAGALARHGIPADDPRVPEYRELYFRILPEEIERKPAAGVRHGVMPGVRELLDALVERRDVYLGLLTGNYHESARIKLQYFDLWRYFGCGAFAEDATDRNGLLSKAFERVVACGGPAVAAQQTVIIGDTPFDIGVALAGGARSIGVATGSHSEAALIAAGADVVFEDLSDTLAVLSVL